MTLWFVIHRPEEGDAGTPAPSAEAASAMRSAVRDAMWEIADAHWALGQDAALVSTDLSPDYLVEHFRRALARRGFDSPGLLLVATAGPRAAWCGLPPEADAWLRETMP